MSLANQSVYPSQPLDRHGCPRQELDPGMTLLQHYAGLAMQGLVSSGCSPSLSGFTSFEHWAAFRSVSIAKALIAELEKEAT